MSWAEDWQRCSEAGVASGDDEGNVEFVTTSKLVRRMLERLVAKHGKQVVGWFTGGRGLRRQPWPSGPNTSPAVEGGKGHCLDDWLPIDPGAHGHLLVVRRSISKPSELACYICHRSRPVPMADLVRVTGSRWGVEDTFQFTNNRPVWTTTVPHVGRLITQTSPASASVWTSARKSCTLSTSIGSCGRDRVRSNEVIGIPPLRIRGRGAGSRDLFPRSEESLQFVRDYFRRAAERASTAFAARRRVEWTSSMT
jgi:hypothetical protein